MIKIWDSVYLCFEEFTLPCCGLSLDAYALSSLTGALVDWRAIKLNFRILIETAMKLNFSILYLNNFKYIEKLIIQIEKKKEEMIFYW